MTALTNNNYVVDSPLWDNGTTIDAGAVTFGDGLAGVSGVVRNSLGNYTVTISQALVSGGAQVSCCTAGGNPNVQGAMPSGGVATGANTFLFTTLANSAVDPDTVFIQAY